MSDSVAHVRLCRVLAAHQHQKLRSMLVAPLWNDWLQRQQLGMDLRPSPAPCFVAMLGLSSLIGSEPAKHTPGVRPARSHVCLACPHIARWWCSVVWSQGGQPEPHATVTLPPAGAKPPVDEQLSKEVGILITGCQVRSAVRHAFRGMSRPWLVAIHMSISSVRQSGNPPAASQAGRHGEGMMMMARKAMLERTAAGCYGVQGRPSS